LALIDFTKPVEDYAKEVEEGMYLSAKSLQHYKDPSTIMTRVVKTLDFLFRLKRLPGVQPRIRTYEATVSSKKQGEHPASSMTIKYSSEYRLESAISSTLFFAGIFSFSLISS
jgi:hypothetical protein